MAYSTIKDPSAHFQVKLYAGTSGLNIPVTHTNDGNSDLQPDLIWFKETDAPGGYDYEHYLVDSSRGRAKGLHPDGQEAETTTAATTNDLVSFDSDGFKVGAPSEGNSTNGANTNKVAWQWKANGGTTTSVSASGTGNQCINACTYQANTTAGFSIITYTGRDDQLNNAHESKLTHGLGVKPKVFWCKRRDGTSNWYYMGGEATGALRNGWYNGFLSFNNENAVNGNYYVSNTEPDSTYIYLGNQLVNTVDSWIGYAFAEIQGYSKFSQYIGNGSADGTFVHTGFKPAFVMVKSQAAGVSWMIQDHKRDIDNPVHHRLKVNSAVAEATNINQMDFLSNGFKMRVNDSSWNTSGQAYGYMAFAENPFVAGGVPTTAR